MGTKLKPGDFDCYANALPDEPMFILLARDALAAEVVSYWIHLKTGGKSLDALNLVRSHIAIGTPKLAEARNCVYGMIEWKAKPNCLTHPGDLLPYTCLKCNERRALLWKGICHQCGGDK